MKLQSKCSFMIAAFWTTSRTGILEQPAGNRISDHTSKASTPRSCPTASNLSSTLMFCLVLSCQACSALSSPLQYNPPLSCQVCPVLPRPVSCPVKGCLILLSRLSYAVLSCHVCPVLLFPVLSCPPFLLLSCSLETVLFCPVLF